jgi:hypothetical protein
MGNMLNFLMQVFSEVLAVGLLHCVGCLQRGLSLQALPTHSFMGLKWEIFYFLLQRFFWSVGCCSAALCWLPASSSHFSSSFYTLFHQPSKRNSKLF